MSAPKPIERLLALMARLRGPRGCPWDRKQTLRSLKPYLVEECYELLEAMDGRDAARHCEELGDLLLQIVFQVQLRRERGQFDFQDVARVLCEKLVRRHPHVFGTVKVRGAGDVLRHWAAIKSKEKGGGPHSVLEGVPRHLPALRRAHQIQARAARVGFDWSRTGDVVAKIDEELREVKQALAQGRATRVREELGDLLFAVVNLGRFRGESAEEALRATVAKFERRFRAIERQVAKRGRSPQDCTLAELDALWEKEKRAERARRRRSRRGPAR